MALADIATEASVTGTWRGLAVLGALAVIALALALFDRPVAPEDRAIVPGLDPATIQYLDGPGFSLGILQTKVVWLEPVGDADPDAIDRLMTALRGGRWHRRAAAHQAGALRGTLVMRTAHDQHAIALGQPLAGTD